MLVFKIYIILFTYMGSLITSDVTMVHRHITRWRQRCSSRPRPLLRHRNPGKRQRAPVCPRVRRGGRNSGAAPTATETDEAATVARRARPGCARVWRHLAGRATVDVHGPGVRDAGRQSRPV